MDEEEEDVFVVRETHLSDSVAQVDFLFWFHGILNFLCFYDIYIY